ncbi:hypothetical protein [Cryptosporangium sp. NPDC048952]
MREVVERSPVGHLSRREQERLLQLAFKALPRPTDGGPAPFCLDE